MKGHVAVVKAQIDATPARVWNALTDPDEIEQYMFGSEVVTDWEPGSRIVWRGKSAGMSYEDHGEILVFEPERRLVMTHFSPLSGAEDIPENYHVVAYKLEEVNGNTKLRLTQDNNPSPEAAEHSRAKWERMLGELKKLVTRNENHVGAART